MNKLLQTILITAVLSTGTMASGTTGSFPETIETGATINVNQNINIGAEGETVTINNYGDITTQKTSDYPTISGVGTSVTIKNYRNMDIKQETETTEITGIKSNNKIEEAEISGDIYRVTQTGGSLNENLILNSVDVENTLDVMVSADKLKSLTNNDLLFLGDQNGNNNQFGIIGSSTGEGIALRINIGDAGEGNPYDLMLQGHIVLIGDVSNYSKGEIFISSSEGGDFINIVGTKDLNAPIAVGRKSGIGIFGANIHKNIQIENEGTISFGQSSTLKSGAVLTIGEPPAGE